MFYGKVDAAGNLIWTNTAIIETGNNHALTIEQAPDSSYYIAGTLWSQSAGSYPFFANVSQSGNILWAKSISPASYFSDMIVTSGGLAFFLYDSNGAIIIRTDFSGNILSSN